MKKFSLAAQGLALAAAVSLAGTLSAQSVSVPGDFATLQLALDSFAVGGSNVGTPNDNEILVAGNIDEVLTIDDTAPGAYENITIVGTNAPNTVIQVQNSGGADGLLISTAASITFQNLIFIPSTTNSLTDDMFFVAPPSEGLSNTITWDSCVLTSNDGAGNPVVTDKASALVDNTASISSIGDDLITVGNTGTNSVADGTNYVFTNSVLSHNTPGTGHDFLVDVADGTGTTTPLYTIESCVISYIARYGIQTSGWGDLTDPAFATYHITGTVDNPTIIANCLRGLQSFLGPESAILDMDNTIIFGNTERGISSDNDLLIRNVDNVIIAQNGGVGIVDDRENIAVTGAFSNVTFDNNGTVLLLSSGLTANVGDTAVYTVTDSIVSDDDATNNDIFAAEFGASDDLWDVQINNSALLTSGAAALAGVDDGAGAAGWVTQGASMESATDPAYTQKNVLTTLETFYLPTAGGNYDTLGSGNIGARFAPAKVSDWTMF